MGLLDKINNIKDLADKATTVTSFLKGNSSDKNKNSEPALPDKTVENGITTINTLDGMSSFLQDMQGNQCTPSAMQALQSQIQVLNFVKSPALTGMAVDTMVMCLYKAIQSAINDTEKDAVRESFALMIQSFMFFNEAQLQYEINSNKEEGMQLLTQAGDVLSKSVVSVAALVASGGVAAASVGNVVVKNVFARQNGQQSFFGKLISFIGDKKRVEEKKKQHFDSLKNTFTTFDRYAEIIGPSIVIHGMLERYARKLVEKFEEEKYSYLLVSVGKAPNLDAAVNDFFDNPLNSFQNKKKRLTGYDYIQFLRNKALENLNKCENELKKDRQELEKTQKEYDGTSSIRFQLRNEIKAKIDRLNEDLVDDEEALQDAKKEITQAEMVVEKAAALEPEIDAYATRINSIVKKFAFNFSKAIGSSASFNAPSTLMSPPPVPDQRMYNISLNGQTSGPFSTMQLQDMITQGTINRDTYVWTQGMSNWEQAGNVQELSFLFGSMPPPPPPIL